MDHVGVSASTTGSGDQSDLPLKLAYLNSALQTGTRSPLDGAIVEFVRQNALPPSAAMAKTKRREPRRLGQVG